MGFMEEQVLNLIELSCGSTFFSLGKKSELSTRDSQAVSCMDYACAHRHIHIHI